MSGLKRILGVMVFFVVLAFFMGVVAAADWNVSAGSSIQSVINGASDNDTVLVNDNNGTACTYTENLVVNKRINLQAGSDLVTIQALNSSKPVITINSLGSGSSVQDFIITGATSSSGIYLNAADNCIITGNDLTGNYDGIRLYKSVNNLISDNTVNNNSRMGVYVYTNSSNNYIQNNFLTSNPYGIYIVNSINNQITSNTVNNSTSSAVYISNVNDTLINQNNFNNNNYGIYLYNAQDNNLTGNTVTDSSRIGIYVNTNSNNNNIQNNNLNGNQYGINTYNCQNNTIVGNSILNTVYYGIYFYNSTQSTVNMNTVDCSNSTGIYLNTGSNNNYLQNNILTSNPYGIRIINSINNQIVSNTVNNSISYAVYLKDSNNTIVGQNNVTGNNYGIYLYNAQNNSFTENTVANNTRIGIYVNTDSNNNNIQNNTLNNNQYGINTYNCLNNTITGNFISNILYYGVYLANSVQNTITLNTINGCNSTGIYLNTNSNDDYILENILTSNLNGIVVRNSLNNLLSGNEVNNCSSYAFYFNNVNNTGISQNNITSNNYGLYLYNSQNNTVNQNTLYNNTRIGIYINTNSNNNNIQNNTLNNNQYGINTYNSLNNNITGNIILNTLYYGIYLSNSTQNTLTQNTINNSNSTGIYLNTNSDNNNIQYNNVSSNRYGIYFNNNSNDNYIQNNVLTLNQYGTYLYITQNNIITSNIINNNTYDGIYLYNSSAVISFNRIAGNGRYGLCKVGSGTVTAVNNWWGSNTPRVSSTSHSDIYMPGGVVAYDPWLVLNTTTYPSVASENSVITVDLSHNNRGDDTSSSGSIPDGIPVNFTTDLGTVTGISYTRNGRANGTFSRDSAISGTANITVSLDNQTNCVSVVIDATAPDVSANLVGGVYDAPIYVSLNAVDGVDPNPVIYFTTDGSDPTTTSNKYTSPLRITSISTTLKFMAVDQAGNQAPITTETYILNVTIININTGNVYSTIQNAIDDPSTLAGDIIEINTGTYIENVVINKKIIIKSAFDHDTYIQATEYSNNVFTITQTGSGTTIQGLSINGGEDGIYLDNTTGCQIIANTIYYNSKGIHLYNSYNNNIIGNTLYNNFEGIYLDSSSNNTISGNNITDYHSCGIDFYNSSSNLISYNTLWDNTYGIQMVDSSENTFRNNSFADWDIELDIKGSCLHDFIQDIDTSNIINGNPIYYLVGRSNLVFDSVPMGYLALISCDNITVKNYLLDDEELPQTINGVLLVNTTHSTIQNLTINTCYLLNSSNNTISGVYTSEISLESSNNNIISDNGVRARMRGINAIQLFNSSNNVISGNNIIGSNPAPALALSINDVPNNMFPPDTENYAMYLERSSHNVILKNNISGVTGIYLLLSPNNNITENNIETSIYVDSSANNTISSNNLTGNRDSYALYIHNSPLNTLKNNIMANNWLNFGISGENIHDFIQDIDTSNIINGNPIYYLVGRSNLVFDSVPMGYLALISCDNITVENILNTPENTVLTGNDAGILFISTINSIIQNCDLNDNLNGIYIYDSFNNIFSENNLSYNYGNDEINGFFLKNSSNNTISNNIASNIVLESSDDNIISKNNITDINHYYQDYYSGINLESSSGNTISENNITGNENTFEYFSGIILSNSIQNTISCNSISVFFNGIKLLNSTNNFISQNNLTASVKSWTILYQILFSQSATYGISLDGSINNTVSKNNIINNGFGIYLYSASANQIMENYVNDCWAGIILDGSSGNQLSLNTVCNGTYGIYESLFGVNTNSNNNTISINSVRGNSAVGITANGENTSISENNVTDNGTGISVTGYNDNVSGNTVTNNNTGITAQGGGAVISENIVSENNGYGVDINGDYFTVFNNIVSGNKGMGIAVNGNNVHILQNNILQNDGYGINATGVNNTISGNNATNNGNAGIVINGDNATVSNNTAVNNGNNGFNGWSWDGISITGNNPIITSDNIIHDNSRTGLFIRGDNIVLNGFNIYNNGGYGIDISGVNLALINNTFTNNGNAGMVVNSNGVIISGNTVTSNGNRGFQGWNCDGLYVRGDYVKILQNSIIQNNGYGINAGGLNLTISANAVSSNGKDGVNVNGANATINLNNVTSNTGAGVYVNGVDTIISGNTATNNKYGICLWNSIGRVQGNDLTGNQYGICISNSLVQVNFNRIISNSKYGLYNINNGIVNATDNWWGSNNGPVVSSTSPSDIDSSSGTVDYNTWLVLSVTAHPSSTTNSSTITADLTHNNEGNDTSPRGNVPDNIPVTFITTLGNITSPAYTRNGKANATFNRGTFSSGTANVTITLDNQNVQTNVVFGEVPLAIFVNTVGGMYNTTQNVTLTTVDTECDSTTYYTTDGSDPRVNGIVYTNPVEINTTTTLRYIAFSPTINWGPEYTQTYIIDTTAPTANANIIGGVYNTTQTVNITATDNEDPNPIIYYTLDGSDPTKSSSLYTGPIMLEMNLLTRTIIDLKFMAVDLAGNNGLIQKETYILTLPVVNINNNHTYSLIQDAINDNLTLNGDVIEIYSGTYLETVIVNKKLTIMPVSNNNVTIQAADSNHNVFTITNSGNGSIIQYLTLNGNINLQANDCTIYMNTITGNGTSGIITSNSVNNAIIYNDITCNGFNGIQTNSSSNTIYGNTIQGCVSGIYSENSNNKISSNDLTNNLYGIWTYISTDTIHFNRIAQNTYGLRNDVGDVNATNNWWGTNNPSNPNDIWIVSGNVNYTQWLVLSVNASSTNSGGNSSVTADLTHNNQGEDTTPQGHVPNGIPVNFTTNYGTIVTTSYTVKGRAATILNLGSTQNATVTTAASLDNQNIPTTGFISTGTAILTINSTAIDNSTGQPLNTTYDIPLNNSVTWLSVVWINTGMFTEELQIIVDGIVVQDKYFYNAAYTTWQNSYSTSVFNAIIYANRHLPFIDSAELISFWNNLTTTYNLTSTELEFIQNHTQDFKDNLTVNIVYPGVTGLNLTVTDPHSNVIDLNFPGNVIQRTSQVIYTGSPGEGVKSFAIATTAVTDDVMQYWQNQYSSYQTGDVMNVAYNTFLTALMVEYVHDKIADNITTSLNVTWSRTNPIIVSVSEGPYQIYETLESDHSMGMTVVGQPANIYVFNYITSLYISPIENKVMSNAYNATFSSVTMELIYTYYNYRTYVETFEDNGFVIIKSLMNDNFLVLDPETGIIRDINTVNNCYGGIYECGGRTTGFGFGYFFKESTQCIGTITWMGFKYYWWQVPDPWDLGNYSFVWNGTGRVFISGNDRYLVSIRANNILNITGPNGIKQVVGMQPALDITNILENAGIQTLHLVLKDTDGGFIETSPLYIVQKTLDRNDLELPPLFPCPIPTWPPLPWNGTYPPYDPFAYPDSEVPIEINKIFNDFWREHVNWYSNEREIPNPNFPLPPIPVYTNGQWMWLRLYLYI
ncbi:hypothetical protein MB9_2377 [Methanobacterium formicicum]|uniref:Carbohydrate-binding/sugar hydrolysis domain-containing protein n=1 Tax=Methanobacterium formicicum TaxID=2162 RepID=A0A0S4FV74_METFO|nr:hypothetical protein MB9_2377 [Methanobacterium formicicum]